MPISGLIITNTHALVAQIETSNCTHTVPNLTGGLEERVVLWKAEALLVHAFRIEEQVRVM